MSIITSTPATTFGHIETSYKQSDITKSVYAEYGVKTRATDSGVCMAMSAEYLAKSQKGEDFYAWLSDSQSKWQVVSSYLDNSYQALSPTEAQARIEDELKSHLDHVGTYQMDSDDFVPETVAQAMSLAFNDDKSTFNMCYLLMPNGGPGHAVACIKDDQDHIRFMDPNIGELSFASTTEFENWMSNVFEKKYSAFSDMVVNLYEAPPSLEPQTIDTAGQPAFHNFV